MNQVVLLGRLTKDPEVRYTTTNNTCVASFTLAINRKVQQGQEQQSDFIPIVAWTKLGEFCGKYFKKGMQVAIVGRLQTRTWSDQTGNKRYITEVVASEAHFADSKKSTETDTNSNENNDNDFVAVQDEELPF